jgi:hypothetical protein
VAPITETQLKLRDAGIQMKLALQNTTDEIVFRSCINAFIMASRSILEVMKEESQNNRRLFDWYERQVSNLKQMPIERFFFQQRDLTMHRGNVKPRSLTAPIKNFVANGEQILDEGTLMVWVFDGIEEFIPGDSGNVIRLCDQLSSYLSRWSMRG